MGTPTEPDELELVFASEDEFLSFQSWTALGGPWIDMHTHVFPMDVDKPEQLAEMRGQIRAASAKYAVGDVFVSDLGPGYLPVLYTLESLEPRVVTIVPGFFAFHQVLRVFAGDYLSGGAFPDQGLDTVVPAPDGDGTLTYAQWVADSMQDLVSLAASFSEVVPGVAELLLCHISRGPTHEFMAFRPDHALVMAVIDAAAAQSVPVVEIHMEAISSDFAAWKPELWVDGKFDLWTAWLGTSAYAELSVNNPKYLEENWPGFLTLVQYAHQKGVKLVWHHLGQSYTDTGPEFQTWLRDQLASIWGTTDPTVGGSLRDTLFVSIKPGEGAPLTLDLLTENGDGRFTLNPEWADFFETWSDQFMLGSDTVTVQPRLMPRLRTNAEPAPRGPSWCSVGSWPTVSRQSSIPAWMASVSCRLAQIPTGGSPSRPWLSRRPQPPGWLAAWPRRLPGRRR